MSAKLKWVAAISIFFILISQLYILYYIKYSNQDLSLSNFRLFIPGNIINFVFTVVLTSGLLIYLIKNRNNFNIRPVVTYTFVTSLLLFICFLSLYIKIPPGNIYIFEQTLSKFIVGFFFTLYLFAYIMFISFILLKIFTGRDFIFLRALFTSLVIIILLLLSSHFYIEVNMKRYSDKSDNIGSNNLAVVLGAAVWSENKPSPTLSSRIDKAVKLYDNGVVNKILLTGSNAPGELTEAEVAFNYIINKDVDTTDILLESHTTSTSEQIRFIKNNLAGSKRFDNIFIISDKYHLARVKEISRFYNLKVILSPSELELSFNSKMYNRLRECIALSLFWCFAL